MNRSVFLLATALVASSAAAALAATEDECKTMWTTADVDKDGVLKGPEAERYAAALRVAEKPVSGDISQTVFMENCTDDVFDTAAVEPGAPFEGANSFTEGQAQDRVMAAGFSGVSSLAKDDKGIWRGTASLNGKNVNVAVDYKGNVVGQ